MISYIAHNPGFFYIKLLYNTDISFTIALIKHIEYIQFLLRGQLR